MELAHLDSPCRISKVCYQKYARMIKDFTGSGRSQALKSKIALGVILGNPTLLGFEAGFKGIEVLCVRSGLFANRTVG